MRLIFFFLVFVNLVIFGWGFLFVESDEGVSERGESPLLVGETGKEFDVRPAVTEENVNPVVESSPPPLCHIVGPFATSEEGDDFIERLASMDVRSGKHELELSVGVSHWLYLPPESSRKDALRKLAELQSQGIDSYVIPKGEFMNGISLGMFTRKELADSQLKEIIKKGWAPQMKEIDRTQMEVWVMVNHQDGQKLSDVSWKRLMDGFILQEVRKNFCLDVASDENIH